MAGIAETASLVAALSLDTKKFDAGAASAAGSLKKLESTSFKVGQDIGRGLNRAAANIKKIGIVAGVGLVGAITLGVRSLGDLERAQLQTEAVIKSTGGKAKVSAEQVRDYAEALENVTTVDDKVIQDGENMLLTFTNIGSAVFPAATKAATNMAVAMAGGNVEAVDLKASAIQLGKALNDPVKGITALSKVGVTFTEAQKKQIVALTTLSKKDQEHYKALRKTNKAEAERFKQTKLNNGMIAAQRIILAELNTEFGKAGEAAGKGPEAVMRRLQDAGEGVSQVLARGVLPALEEFGIFLTEKLSDKGFLDAVDEFGRDLGKAVRGALDFIKGVDFNGIKSALGTAAGFAKDLMGAFLNAPTWLQTAIITGWGLNKLTGGAVTDIFGTLASGLIKGVLGMNAGVVNINAATVNGVPGVGAPGGGGGVGLLAAATVGGAAAVGSKAIADFTNAEFRGAGFQNVDFEAPGGGPFGVTSLVHNIQQLVGLMNQRPVIKDDRNLDRPSTVGPAADKQREAIEKVQTEVESMKGRIADELVTVTGKTGEVKTEVTGGASRVAGAATQAGNTVAAAVRASRPITNVEVNVSATTVQKTVDVITRYGNPGSDRDTKMGNDPYEGGMGGH